jgi:hypothetical protein
MARTVAERQFPKGSPGAALAEKEYLGTLSPAERGTLASLRASSKPLAPAKTTPVEQSHHVVGSKIYCETAITVDAPMDKALAAVQGDWSVWWGHGRVTNRQPGPGGSATYNLGPVVVAGEGPINVRVEMAAPKVTKTPDGREKLVMDVKLSGDFTGPAHLDIERTKDGKTRISSNWEGVEPTGWKQHLPELIANIHLAAEGGKVLGLSGGGFAGLAQLLQRK